MRKILKIHGLLRLLAKDKGGASTIEYAIMAGMIALVIIGVVQHFGVTLSGSYSNVSSSLNAVNDGG